MNVEDILQVLRDRGAALYVEAGRLKYRGLRRPTNDPLRTAIAEHRDALVLLFSNPRPAIHPAGWSDRLAREVYETGAQPGTWIETEASAALCIWCPAPLAVGNRLGCETHRTPALVTDSQCLQAVAVTTEPPVGRDTINTLVVDASAQLEGAA